MKYQDEASGINCLWIYRGGLSFRVNEALAKTIGHIPIVAKEVWIFAAVPMMEADTPQNPRYEGPRSRSGQHEKAPK